MIRIYPISALVAGLLLLPGCDGPDDQVKIAEARIQCMKTAEPFVPEYLKNSFNDFASELNTSDVPERNEFEFIWAAKNSNLMSSDTEFIIWCRGNAEERTISYLRVGIIERISKPTKY